MKKLLFIASSLLAAGCTASTNSQLEERNIYVKAPYLHPEQAMVWEEEITPQVYALAATRTTNKMLDETRDIYENSGNIFLYVMEPKKLDTALPDGFHYAQKVTTGIIEGSNNYKLVNNMNEADYYLEVLVDKGGNLDVPSVIYKMILFDNENVQIGEWTETVRRIRNDDRSWW